MIKKLSLVFLVINPVFSMQKSPVSPELIPVGSVLLPQSVDGDDCNWPARDRRTGQWSLYVRDASDSDKQTCQSSEKYKVTNSADMPGFLSYSIIENPLEILQLSGVISDLHVRSDLRRNGRGTFLLKQALLAMAKKVPDLNVNAYLKPEESDASRIFLRLGFNECRLEDTLFGVTLELMDRMESLTNKKSKALEFICTKENLTTMELAALKV